MDSLNSLAREFVSFCVQRNGREWPALYDEMCWVAGHRLFKGMGYDELRKLGLSLSLAGIDDTIRVVDSVITRK